MFVMTALGAAALMTTTMTGAAGCGAGGKAPGPQPEAGGALPSAAAAQAPAPVAPVAEAAAAHGPGESAAGETPDDEPIPDDLVRASLLADVTHVVPGQTMVVAVRFDIAPGWHIYWQNPGEAGLATNMELAAPAGFEVGPVRYPGPVRFESPGPVVSYGYAGQALLSVEVQTPATVAAKEHTFSARTSWLACKHACVRGTAQVELRLPAAARDMSPAPANQDELAAHAAHLPRPWAELAGARHAWQAGPGLVLAVPGAARLAFFPADDNQVALAGQEMAADSQETTLHLVYEPGSRLPRAHGVLAVEQGGRTTFYTIDIPRPRG